jgi:hypothetical protein
MVIAMGIAAAALTMNAEGRMERAQAQPSIDVAALIKLVEEQPADMDRTVWKEKRRDAAKRLGTIRDKRAVATLSKLAETETFDIIGEIAIQGLGQLGDPAAVPVLQRIAADISREKAQRELARKTLAKLGAPGPSGSAAGSASGSASASASASASGSGSASASGSASGSASASGSGRRPTPSTSGSATSSGSSGTGSGGVAGGKDDDDDREGAAVRDQPPSSALLGDGGDIPAGPTWAPEVLAAHERLTLAAGSAQLSYDTVRKRPAFDADVAAAYVRRVEEERRVLAWGGDARVVAGYVNPDGTGASRGGVVTAGANAEARFYSGKLYGIGQAAASLQLTYLSIDRVDPNADDTKDVRTSGDLSVALGGGYGRVLDQSAQLRVRRLGRALETNRALGRPIDEETSRALQSAWWALRGARSERLLLTATVSILRKAGVLLGEPDAGLTYEMLTVLRDGQLVDRPSGFDVWLGFGEGFLVREDEPAVAEGRVEQLLMRARFGQQSEDTLTDLSAEGFGRLALFTGDQPAPWALGVAARARRFTYGEYGDPIGAIDLGAELGLSSDDQDETSVGLRIAGELGFTWTMNLASQVRLSAKVVDDAGELQLIAGFEARYGLLDGVFSAPP